MSAGHHHHHHGHGGSHDDHHTGSMNRAFAIGTVINLLFAAGEAAAGFITGSVALLADAGHNFADVLGLALAWVAASFARSEPTARHSYGFKRGTILAALANALVISATAGALALESATRIFDPPPVRGMTVIAVAAIGVVINTGSALLFMSGRKHDLNVRAAFLHLAADAAISLAVVVAGFGMLQTGWYWLDPVVAIGVSAMIFLNSWSLLRQSLALSLDAAPDGIDPATVRDWLAAQPGVNDVHHLHIWALSTTETALTVHLVVKETTGSRDDLLVRVGTGLREQFRIGHITVQIEDSCCPETGRQAAG